jgi:hypothetical protein
MTFGEPTVAAGDVRMADVPAPAWSHLQQSLVEFLVSLFQAEGGCRVQRGSR